MKASTEKWIRLSGTWPARFLVAVAVCTLGVLPSTFLSKEAPEGPRHDGSVAASNDSGQAPAPQRFAAMGSVSNPNLANGETLTNPDTGLLSEVYRQDGGSGGGVGDGHSGGTGDAPTGGLSENGYGGSGGGTVLAGDFGGGWNGSGGGSPSFSSDWSRGSSGGNGGAGDFWGLTPAGYGGDDSGNGGGGGSRGNDGGSSSGGGGGGSGGGGGGSPNHGYTPPFVPGVWPASTNDPSTTPGSGSDPGSNPGSNSGGSGGSGGDPGSGPGSGSGGLPQTFADIPGDPPSDPPLNFALSDPPGTSPVPEPSTFLLVGSALAGVVAIGKKRRGKGRDSAHPAKKDW